MNTSTMRRIVKFIRKSTKIGPEDLEDVLVDRFEIGYDEAAILIQLSKTNF